MGPGASTLIPSQAASETTHLHARPHAIPARTLPQDTATGRRRLDNGSHPHHQQQPRKWGKRQFTIRPSKRKRSLCRFRQRHRDTEIPPHSTPRKRSIPTKRKPFNPQQHLSLHQPSHAGIQRLGNPSPNPEARNLRPRRRPNATVRRAASTETPVAYGLPGAI